MAVATTKLACMDPISIRSYFKVISQSPHKFWIRKFNAECNYRLLPIDGDVPTVWGPMERN